MTRLVVSDAAAVRGEHAARFVAAAPPATEVLVVARTREAADDFARERTLGPRGASFGLSRASLTQLVARLAAASLARGGQAPLGALGAEAVAARAAFEAVRAGRAPELEPVMRFPGFPRALARSIADLREAGLDEADLAKVDAADLAAMLELYRAECARAHLADRASLLGLARSALEDGSSSSVAAGPCVLLDVPVRSALEAAFVRALCARAASALVTIPAGDERTLASLEGLGEIEHVSGSAGSRGLERLRRYVFAGEPPPRAEPSSEVTVMSAPGEGRECLEIARRILDFAREGTSFDRIAVIVRGPEVYNALLETALGRAGIPAWFAQGMRRPDPSGRAFLALLACRAEGLSARRFAEYLAFGQVPELEDGAPPPAPAERPFQPPEDEVLGRGQLAFAFAEAPAIEPTPEPEPEDAPARDGTLRAPWKWEELLVEAAVVGGTDRWRRRLNGLERELRLRLAQLRSDEPGSSRAVAVERELADCAHLERFALPVVETLASFPEAARWGQWLRLLAKLAPRVLREPERVLAVLAELEPMAAVGPVEIEEVRVVLAARLSTIEKERPASRFGRVFVGTPDQVRGRSFSAVFVPGLAERLFPERPREDPLLLDDVRRRLGARLDTQEDRSRDERLMLRLALGAAEDRVVLSYPRIELVQARPRVPSFYALDVVRAITGAIPDAEELERSAAAEAEARLGWPAPPDARRSLDALEHDLAVLGPLLHAGADDQVAGRARYLLELSAPLGRSLRTRWSRWQKAWSPADGLVRSTAATEQILAAHRLTARAYSVTALQSFAACPYRFLLGAIHRLEPRKEARAIETLDPRTRGLIFHDMQAKTLGSLREARLLPLSMERLERARSVLDATVDRLAEAYRDDLVPAIVRVWQDEIDAMRADLRIWLRSLAEAPEWEPAHFELAFGLPGIGGRDPASRAEPVVLEGGYRLRGSVDLVERGREGTLRVTDNKTGRNRTHAGFVVGGGETLQPALYALAVEQATGSPVAEGRLYFCTARGGFTERVVPLHALAREWSRQVLATVDEAVGRGDLRAAPNKKACEWCDFIAVCGPGEELRTGRKDPRPLEALKQLRGLP